MNQSSTSEAFSLLSLARDILASAQERSRRQSVATDVKEIWDILKMLNVRPSAIGSSAAAIRQMLITGHLAEARRIFLNASTTASSPEELNSAFKEMCDNLVTAMRMPAPPPPSISAPPVTTDVTCAVLVMNDPFQNPPNDAAKIIGATAVDEFENDGVEPTEVSVSDMQTVEATNVAANDCPTPDSIPQTLESPHDHAFVARFFGGKKGAEEFGFVPPPQPEERTSEALLAELSSVSPPHSDEVACADRVQEEAMPPARDNSTFEAASSLAS